VHSDSRHDQDQEEPGEHDQPRHHGTRAREQRRSPVLDGSRAGEIADDRVELAVRSGGKGRPEALLELFGKQPSLTGRVTEALSRLFAVAIGCSQRVRIGDRQGVRDWW
jgi:hypothetical protein